MREEIQALQAALSLLRNIYINAEIDAYGNAVIDHEFPIFHELLTVESRIERVIASALQEPAGHKHNGDYCPYCEPTDELP